MEELWFLFTAFCIMPINTQANFQSIKVMLPASTKCCKNDDQRNINQRKHVTRQNYGSFTLHSLVLQQTQMPYFKPVGLEMTK